MKSIVRCQLPARRSQDGAAAVEFALILPVLAMLMMGILTGGLSYSNALGVQNAVREGSRFGATGDQSSSTWATDVIARTRSTQFDDSPTATGSQTSVCVQLVQAPSTTVETECSVGGAGGPSLSMPPFTAYPAVPSSLEGGMCAVRVIAARNFEINVVVATFDSAVTRGSVARYERAC